MSPIPKHRRAETTADCDHRYPHSARSEFFATDSPPLFDDSKNPSHCPEYAPHDPKKSPDQKPQTSPPCVCEAVYYSVASAPAQPLQSPVSQTSPMEFPVLHLPKHLQKSAPKTRQSNKIDTALNPPKWFRSSFVRCFNIRLFFLGGQVQNRKNRNRPISQALST